MVAKEISSLQHPLVKLAVRLRLEKQAREAERMVLLSGKKALLEQARLPIVFFTEGEPPLTAAEAIRVTPEILKKITGLEEPDGWAALVDLPQPQSLFDKRRLLILDGLADPGNAGTLWRTALALGWEGVWLMSGTVDPFNDKALRAAKGATFRLPYEWAEPGLIADWKERQGAALLAADLEGTPLSACKAAPPLALILGNEGQGLSPWSQGYSQRVTIPLAPGAESLNVAAAGAIFLYELRGRP